MSEKIDTISLHRPKFENEARTEGSESELSDLLCVGDEVSFYWGGNIRVASIIKIETGRVLLCGITAQYWMKKKSLLGLIRKADPNINTSMYDCFNT